MTFTPRTGFLLVATLLFILAGLNLADKRFNPQGFGFAAVALALAVG
jgi:hypothetical protein